MCVCVCACVCSVVVVVCVQWSGCVCACACIEVVVVVCVCSEVPVSRYMMHVCIYICLLRMFLTFMYICITKNFCYIHAY